MAHVAVPVVVLEDGVVDNTAQVAVTTADTFEITGLDGRLGKTALHIVGNGATVTFDAGTIPPSHRAGMGDLAVAITSTAGHWLVIEGQRFLDSPEAVATDRNTITGSVAGANVTIAARQIGNSV